MKKNNDIMRYLMGLTIGIFMVMGSLAQTTITIGNGGNSDFYLPANGNYEYNWSAIIYLQSDIGIAGDISEISFYVSLYADGGSSYSMDNQMIYMAHAANDEFSNTDKPDPSSMTKVYDGNITWNGTGWFSIPLDTDFYYNNSDNLMIYYENNNGSYTWDYPEFRYTLLLPFYAKEDHADGSFPTGSGTEMNRPDIKLVITKSTLPVELLDFNANCQTDALTLSWTTASEINNDHFIVERSKDGNKWTNIASITGAGNTSQLNHYSAEDKHPFAGINYYRLKQVDFNGETETFKVISENCKNNHSEPDITIYPNPFEQRIVIIANNLNNKSTILRLTDTNGKTIKKWAVSHHEPSFQKQFDASDLNTGMYILQVINKDYIKQFKLHKQ